MAADRTLWPTREGALTDFPSDFVWGTASSAYQIEGAVHEDGRGPSVWDTFSHTPGRTRNGDTGDVACDHYHRYGDDIDLMADLGVGAYRFSVAWPRVLPQGRGAVNTRGLDFYDRIVDTLLARNIQPWVCLHHWDMPQAIEDAGGWRSRDTAAWFAEYGAVVMRRLGDRVRYAAPINEPNVIPWVAYDLGVHAPGRQSREDVIKAIHHVNLAHGMAISAIRSEAPAVKAGSIISLGPVHPARDDDAHREAAELVDCFWRRVMCDPIWLGTYPEPLAREVAPLIKPGDLEVISQPLDFFGLNHYNRMYAAPDPTRTFGVADVAPPAGVPLTDVGWQIDPSGLLEQLRDVTVRYNAPPIFITENGGAFPDKADASGQVQDDDRIAYVNGYLGAVLGGVEEGIDIRGYFIWSLLDNFEWAEGYAKRFGIVRVDYETQRRTPKASYRWLRHVIAENRLSPIPAAAE